MEKELLAVKGLSVSVEDKPILDHVNLEIGTGETHVLMGPNGTGKSTLGYTLMGSPRYHVTEGQIMFKGKDITHMAANERAKLGMFLSFQAPLEVPGVTLGAFIRNAVELQTGAAACACGASKRSLSARWSCWIWIRPTPSAI